MNRIYEAISETYRKALSQIYKFSTWRVKRLTRAIDGGDANLDESDDYINKLEDNRDFWEDGF